MSRKLSESLSPKYFETLQQILPESKKYQATHLFEACSLHANYALEKFKENLIIDFETAEKLATAFKGIEENWQQLSEEAKDYLKASMYYFAICEDDQPDFSSSTGFDDDIEVINACLTFAGLEELTIDLKRK
ncbi:MAG: hypothetical protein MK132_18655 [Lentisphaerales bacterium]|nr:hypothetical protein [Lentisphaerales bacterium]